MARMRGVQKIGSVWKVRKRIPPECRAAFGGVEVLIRSLGTKNERDAIVAAAPILAEIDAKIALARGAEVSPPAQPVRFNPLTAFDAIQRWRRTSIDTAYDAAWNGSMEPVSDRGRLRYNLQSHHRIADIPDFNERLVDALAGEGISFAADHPAVLKPTLREWFRKAWLDVEAFTERFSHDDFNGWPEDEEEVSPSVVTAPVAQAASMTLSQLRDAWDAVKPLEPRHKGYIRRLIEFLGDPDIAAVQPLDLDRFLIALRQFPMTKRPIDDIPFRDLVGALPDVPRLHVKTVWNWTVTYKAMFAFAVSRRLLTHNPADAMMKKPSAEESDERLPYDADDIAAIFSAPLFTGSDGSGYRDRPGSIVTRDHRYWLPILAIWTGARVEELASLRGDEVKVEDGVWFIDLTGRPLVGPRRVKNASARRAIPLHDKLIDLGILQHVQTLSDPTGMVFPELSSDGKASADFTKWWGRWSEKTAKVKGQGIDDPMKVFHSFRHAWKRAARMSAAKEEIHDLISGHKDGNGVARGYGRGVDLPTLKAAMDEIAIPGFGL